jgi:hypothetical protein
MTLVMMIKYKNHKNINDDDNDDDNYDNNHKIVDDVVPVMMQNRLLSYL